MIWASLPLKLPGKIMMMVQRERRPMCLCRDDAAAKDGEKAEKATLGYFEPRIRAVLDLVYPGCESVHVESNVFYKIPEYFQLKDKFKMFLK